MGFCDATGKLVYENRSEAAADLHHIERRRGRHKTLHPYRCQFCGCYHLGRQPLKGRKR